MNGSAVDLLDLLQGIRQAVEACRLDLSGLAVLTEAATGPYAVTAVIAATAGASQVIAVAADSRHGAAAQAAQETAMLAALAGVEGRLLIVSEKRPGLVLQADIVTNSGHVRPIDATTVGWMKPTAVLPLMYEAWELRAEDVDLGACRRKQIAVAGTNEAHPALGILDRVGDLALAVLARARVAVRGRPVVVVADNKLGGLICRTLRHAGASPLFAGPPEEADGLSAEAWLGDLFAGAPLRPGHPGVGAVVIAARPRAEPIIGRGGGALLDAEALAARWPGAVVLQVWGDIDRGVLQELGVDCFPGVAPPPGHMGLSLTELGGEPVTRLQTAGLKVGEIMARCRLRGEPPEAAVEASVQAGYGQRCDGTAEEDHRACA